MIGLLFFSLKSADVRGEGTRDARLRLSAGEAKKKAYSVAFGSLQTRRNTERRREILLSPNDVAKLC